MRPVALAGATGGLASWALQILREATALDPSPALFDSCPICEGSAGIEIFGLQIHWASLFVGICLGLVLGPVLDCLYLLRQLWSLQLRSFAAGWRPIRGGFRVVG